MEDMGISLGCLFIKLYAISDNEVNNVDKQTSPVLNFETSFTSYSFKTRIATHLADPRRQDDVVLTPNRRHYVDLVTKRGRSDIVVRWEVLNLSIY